MNSQNLQPSEKSDRHLRVAEKSNGNTKKQHYTFYQIPDISNSLHFRAHRSIHLKHNMFGEVGHFAYYLPHPHNPPTLPEIIHIANRPLYMNAYYTVILYDCKQYLVSCTGQFPHGDAPAGISFFFDWMYV